jgi:hypothetical protein
MEGIVFIIIIIGVVLAVKGLISNSLDISEKSAAKWANNIRNIDNSASHYEKKPYLFDHGSEFQMFKMLNELYGSKYFIFPQINYNHIIQPKNDIWREWIKNKSRIDKKSADFVICDKERVCPIVIIELDGSSHNRWDRVERDKFVDDVASYCNFPIVHIKTWNSNKEFVKSQIDHALGVS